MIAALGDAWMNWEYLNKQYCGKTLHITNVGSNDGVGGKGYFPLHFHILYSFHGEQQKPNLRWEETR
jgi:hypothetical protein